VTGNTLGSGRLFQALTERRLARVQARESTPVIQSDIYEAFYR
jgi:hypothetical protein